MTMIKMVSTLDDLMDQKRMYWVHEEVIKMEKALLVCVGDIERLYRLMIFPTLTGKSRRLSVLTCLISMLLPRSETLLESFV